MLSLVQWSMSVNNGMKLRGSKIGLNIKEKNYLTERSIRIVEWSLQGVLESLTSLCSSYIPNSCHQFMVLSFLVTCGGQMPGSPP